jgi:uncharacterized membrane protein
VKAVVIALLLSGCSIATYEDGSIHAWGAAFGTNKALDGLQYMKSKEGTQFQIKGLTENQTEGLTAIVSGAVQGAIAGVKP